MKSRPPLGDRMYDWDSGEHSNRLISVFSAECQ